MTDVDALLRTASTVLLIDWPDREVPDTLARHGYTIVSRDGPSEAEYNAYELVDGEVRVRHVGHRPSRSELVYSHRPLDELPDLVAAAKAVGARALWLQSGLVGPGVKDRRGCWRPEEESRRAREVVEPAGLVYIDRPSIVEALGRLD